MSFTKSSRKPTRKVSSESAVVSFDLVSNLTYMAALATGGPERDVILEWTIKQDYKTVGFFRQVYLLSKRLGFEYARSFRLVARKANAPSIKNLLLRFAGAISSGVSEADFLAEEAKVEREQYINSYHRSLESLSKWGDAYAAMLVSVSLIVVVAMMSTMLSNLGSSFVLILTGATTMVSAFGVYIIYRIAPYEVKTYQSRHGPKERQWAKRLFYTVVPAGFLIGIVVGFTQGFPFFLILLGMALLPSGVMAWIDNGKVNKRDQEIAPFLRSLGNVTASLGTTVSVSLDKIDRRALGTLEPTIRRLQIRLRKHISPERSWDAFRDEAGSELISRATRMFVDGVSLGGPPERVGAISADSGHKVDGVRPVRTEANTSPDGTEIVVSFSENVGVTEDSFTVFYGGGSVTVSSNSVKESEVKLALAVPVKDGESVDFAFAENVVADVAGNGNAHQARVSVTNNVDNPTLAITSPRRHLRHR